MEDEIDGPGRPPPQHIQLNIFQVSKSQSPPKSRTARSSPFFLRKGDALTLRIEGCHCGKGPFSYVCETSEVNRSFFTTMKKKGEVIFFMDGRENIEKEGSQLVELFWEMLNRRLPKKCVSRIRATTLDIPICLKWNPMEALLNLEAVEEFIERAGPKHFKLKKIVKFFGTQELSMYEWVQGNPFNSLVGKGTMHRPKWADDILEELTEITKKIEDERLAYHVDINPGNVIYRGTENGLPVISIIDQYKDGQEWFRNGYI